MALPHIGEKLLFVIIVLFFPNTFFSRFHISLRGHRNLNRFAPVWLKRSVLLKLLNPFAGVSGEKHSRPVLSLGQLAVIIVRAFKTTRLNCTWSSSIYWILQCWTIFPLVLSKCGTPTPKTPKMWVEPISSRRAETMRYSISSSVIDLWFKPTFEQGSRQSALFQPMSCQKTLWQQRVHVHISVLCNKFRTFVVSSIIPIGTFWRHYAEISNVKTWCNPVNAFACA